MASDEARVITEATPPFRITHVNAAWEELCGYRRAEVLGLCGFAFLQARPATAPLRTLAISALPCAFFVPPAALWHSVARGTWH